MMRWEHAFADALPETAHRDFGIGVLGEGLPCRFVLAAVGPFCALC